MLRLSFELTLRFTSTCLRCFKLFSMNRDVSFFILKPNLMPKNICSEYILSLTVRLEPHLKLQTYVKTENYGETFCERCPSIQRSGSTPNSSRTPPLTDHLLSHQCTDIMAYSYTAVASRLSRLTGEHYMTYFSNCFMCFYIILFIFT